MIFLNKFSEINFEYIIVGVILAVLYMVWSIVIKPNRQKKEIKQVLDEVASLYNYKVVKVTKSKYDFVLGSLKDAKYKRILIKVAFVPRVSTLTVNSKNTINLHYGASSRPGGGFPYNRYLDELKPFLNMESTIDELKLILVYKGTLKVQKYLNESEIEIVKIKDKIYDYKIISFEEIKSRFEHL